VDIADDVGEAVGELEERLRRYPDDRYPVQHATAQFHLGVALSRRGDLDGAERALGASAGLFDPARMPVEHAKALNALGAVQRDLGRQDDASESFSRAVELFDRSGSELERAAALFNLGLVRRDLGEARSAAESFREARSIFEERRLPAQTAAAARELGATMLSTGDLDEARAALVQAADLADRAGDRAGLGAAANTLGIVHLAAGHAGEAILAFREAASAHPRGVRPGDHAMAKANLALAHEEAGDGPRARLAARQALGVAGAPAPVREQASAVLLRLGGGSGDLMTVFDGEPRKRWPAVVREEVVRWADAPADEQRGEAAGWIRGQLARPEEATELAEALLGALLELPAGEMDALIRATVEALGDREPGERDRFRSAVRGAMSRFHVPQLMRLKEAFTRHADDLGVDGSW